MSKHQHFKFINISRVEIVTAKKLWKKFDYFELSKEGFSFNRNKNI